MEYRNWNNKPLRTSLLGYGCMRFPTRADGSIDEPRAEALLNTAKAAGVNYFDTAYPYHNGQSEPFVGRVIAKWERSSFYLATKMPLWTCKSLADAQRIFEEQLQRLGVEYIDFYLLHSLHKARYEQAKELGIVDWLWEQKAAGRIRNFGFSCHDNAAGFEAILRDQPWDFCQLQYNYLDTDDRAEEISGDRGYQLTEELNIPLIIPVIGLIYVAEVLSDIIQVVYFKKTHGKRFFRMAPLHHHLELGGWSEVKLFCVFSGVTLLACVLAFLGVMGR
mgnify:CR=1 FL=1